MDGLFIGVGITTYDEASYAPLPHSALDVSSLAEQVGGCGFEVHCLVDPDGDIASHIRSAFRRSTAMIVYWAGHGVSAGPGDLRLILRETSPRAALDETYSPAALGDRALQSGSNQVLLILDTCYSGAAAGEVIRLALQLASIDPDIDGERRWIGVVASAQSYEEAVGGRLAEAVAKLLREGPSKREQQTYWSARTRGIRGVDLLDALRDEWPHTVQLPWFTSFGWSQELLPNPRYNPSRTAEQLVLAARGAGPGEEGWFFRGRRRTLGMIVAWLGYTAPGLLTVTGPAGSGKSAVLGRIVTLSNPELRAAQVAANALSEEDADPGPNSVDVVVNARGKSHDELLREIASGLGLARVASVYGILEQLVAAGHSPVLVLDALDEAQPLELDRIASGLLPTLARGARVLIGSRDSHHAHGTVLGVLAAHGRILDLTSEPDERADISAYVTARLAEAKIPNVGELAEAIAERGGFLYARLVTGQIRAQPPVAGESWVNALAKGAATAFEAELARDDRARPLLTALAYSFGNGLPAWDVWPALASAVAGGRTEFGDDDVREVLTGFGQWITEDGENGRAAYRPFHQELVAHLAGDPAARERCDLAVVELLRKQTAEGQQPEIANPYLRSHLVAHAVRAGQTSFAGLRKLAAGSEDFLPDLAAALLGFARVAGSQVRTGASAAQGGRTYGRSRDDVLAGDYDDEFWDASIDVVTGTSVQEVPGAPESPAVAARGDLLMEDYDDEFWDDDSIDDVTDTPVPEAREAVDIYRRLALGGDPAVARNLADALSVLAGQQPLTSVSYPDEGTRLLQEAVGVRRVLADRDRTELPALAVALGVLALRQTSQRQPAAALVAVEQAVQIRRVLVAANRTSHLPDLARELNNLDIALEWVGRGAEAVDAAEEEVRIWREVAAGSAHRWLAAALAKLAERRSSAGRNEAAVGAAQEALTSYRMLAAEEPATFGGALLDMLRRLSRLLAAAGRHAEAVTAAQHAVDACGDDEWERALTLGDLGTRLWAAGRGHDAEMAWLNAADLYRRMSQRGPAYREQLAVTLRALSALYSEVGRYVEAEVAVAEAADVLRTLTDLDAVDTADRNRHTMAAGMPDDWLLPAIIRGGKTLPPESVFLPPLAEALKDLAALQFRLGRSTDAIATTHEMLAGYGVLADKDPKFAPRLTDEMWRLAQLYQDGGRTHETVEVARMIVRYELARHRSERCLANTLLRYATVLHEAAHAPHWPLSKGRMSGYASLSGRTDQLPLRLYEWLASLLTRLADPDLLAEATDAAAEAIELIGRVEEREDGEVADFHLLLAELRADAGELSEALIAARAAVAGYREKRIANPRDVAPLDGLRAVALQLSTPPICDGPSCWAEAAAIVGEAMAGRRVILAETPPGNDFSYGVTGAGLGTDLVLLADLLTATGRADEAYTAAGEAVRFARQASTRLADRHDGDAFLPGGSGALLAHALIRAAVAASRLGHPEEATALRDEALTAAESPLHRAYLLLDFCDGTPGRPLADRIDDLRRAMSLAPEAAEMKFAHEVIVHQVLRRLRASDDAAFDARWRDLGDELPGWSQVSPKAHDAVMAWLAEDSWAASLETVHGRPALVRDARAVIDELLLLGGETEVVRRHLVLQPHFQVRSLRW